MKILIIGNGGREHALAWKVASSEKVTQVFVAPGNGGTETENKVHNINIDTTDIENLCQFAKQNHIDLTIVGPETPLVNGIVDRFRAEQLLCFGPTKAAAQLEGSKAFTKQFLQRYHIPTAAFHVFDNFEKAKAYLSKLLDRDFPLVIKADGLAAGKGVTIVNTVNEAENILAALLQENVLGVAGQSVVIEEFLSGEELSFIVMVDNQGKQALALASAQDHKTRDNGDTGPNTGGMGAYSPAPVLTDALHHKIMQSIIFPTLGGMEKEGMPYSGFLYAGLMIDAQGEPKVIEFNCRLGDPETQVILPRLSSDLVELLLAAMQNRLQDVHPIWDPRAALGVVLVAEGYPGSYEMHKTITLHSDTLHSDTLHSEASVFTYQDNIKIFHAGTKKQNKALVTAGGRVLCVTAKGKTVTEAKALAYKAIPSIHWAGMHYRTDIGHRATARETITSDIMLPTP